eukprot:869751-Pyramimonas_sp.AAC.1
MGRHCDAPLSFVSSKWRSRGAAFAWGCARRAGPPVKTNEVLAIGNGPQQCPHQEWSTHVALDMLKHHHSLVRPREMITAGSRAKPARAQEAGQSNGAV